MQFNEDEKSEYRNPGYIPPGEESREHISPDILENLESYPPRQAPADQIAAPAIGYESHLQKTPAIRGGDQNGARVFAPSDADWREPAYSQAHESISNMYSPGICTNTPYSRKRVAEPEPERKPREGSGFFGRFIRAACLVIVCAALSGASAYFVMDYRFSRGDFDTVNQVVLGNTSDSVQQSGSITSTVASTGAGMPAQDIYEMACNQVVGISTEVSSTGGIFGFGGQSFAPNTVTGSGFIISNDGYILTNYHVVESAHLSNLPLTVYLIDETSYDARVIGFDASNDVAVLKIDATGLNPASIADSDKIRVGQTVYAVGNPFGNLVYTMTEGIVSALDRIVTVDSKSIDTFQFSAAVNPGNSGGPVYDANGEVIGIVTAKMMRDSVEGIGFAIPINVAIGLASELIEHGYITGRPFIGITVQTVTSGHAEYYGFVEGAYVRSVSPGSAAETAGLMVSDIIIALDDTDIDSRDTLIFTMRRYNAGDSATLKVWRAGEEIELPIVFDEDLAAGQPQRP